MPWANRCLSTEWTSSKGWHTLPEMQHNPNPHRFKQCVDEQMVKQCVDEQRVKQCMDEQTAKQCVDEQRVKQCMDEQTVKQCVDEQTAKQCVDEQRVKQCMDEQTVKQCVDEQMVKQCVDEQTAKQCIDEQRVKQCMDEQTVKQCMDEQRVKQWLDRVKEWKDPEKGLDRRPNDADILQLRSFLRELYEQLVKWGRPSVAVRNLPSVGPLLGHLCNNEALQMQEADCQLVMQCVLALHMSQPNGPLEEKANKWAQSKVRYSVTFRQDRNPCSGVAASIHCSSSRFNNTASCKLLESMVEDLIKIPTTRWDSSTNCLVPCTQLSSNTLRDVSELCLPLVTSGGDWVSPLVETMLSCHGNSTTEAMSAAFLEAVTKSQDGAYVNKCSLELSYEGRVSLWTRYLPALEKEFVSLVRALEPLLPSSEDRANELIHSRNLPRACLEYPQLLSGVETLMRLLLQHTKGSTFALLLMGLFRRCVRESQGTIPASCQCLKRPASEGLRSLLDVDLQELPPTLLAQRINNLSNCLTQHATLPASSLQAWLLLASSQAWYQAVLKTTLLGPAVSLQSCFNILAWYNLPLVSDSHQEYKDQLRELLTMARGLCSKTILHPHDLQNAFDFYDVQRHDSSVRNICRPLLMLLVVYGNVSHHLLQAIVGKATGENQPSCAAKLTFLLDSIEFALSNDRSPRPRDCTQQSLGYQGRATAHALALCMEVCAAYQRERSVGVVTLPDDLHHNLMGRYNRIQKLAETM